MEVTLDVDDAIPPQLTVEEGFPCHGQTTIQAPPLDAKYHPAKDSKKSSQMVAACNYFHGVCLLTKQAHGGYSLASPYDHSYSFVGLLANVDFAVS